ncbi:hypothetical protein [Pedobacter sp.]|jgi:hypothetical protein|nr:hypothetical protein [Pedobacter sp.]HWW42988.1 hypothetical protein [Pedobacter sp.]
MLSLNIPPSKQFLYTKGIVDELQAEIQSRVKNIVTESEGFTDGLIPAIA